MEDLNDFFSGKSEKRRYEWKDEVMFEYGFRYFLYAIVIIGMGFLLFSVGHYFYLPWMLRNHLDKIPSLGGGQVAIRKKKTETTTRNKNNRRNNNNLTDNNNSNENKNNTKNNNKKRKKSSDIKKKDK